MIIHITGPSGAGKTTLGQRIHKATGLRVIDTDDIDDRNALLALKLGKTGAAFDKYKEKRNMVDLATAVARGNVVVVGITIDPAPIAKKINCEFYGYYIDADPDTTFRRVNERHLRCICNNAEAISRLFRTSKGFGYINTLLLHKYKLRRPFGISPGQIRRELDEQKKIFKKKKYVIASAESIYSAATKKILAV